MTTRSLHVAAACGFVVWLVLGAWPGGPRGPSLLLLLAVLVLVPLTRACTVRGRDRVAIAWAPAAALAVFAVLWPTGVWAAVLALGWLAWASVAALEALWRIWRRPIRLVPATVVDIAWVYLPVGCAWLVSSRFGFRPMGFSSVIVLLTAVHFHHAGFTAPVICGLVGDLLPTKGRRPWMAAASLVVAGPPLVAVGITASPVVEVMSAALLAGGLGLLALLVLGLVASQSRPRWAGALLAVAVLANMTAMGLAVAYALGEYTGQGWLDIGQMVSTHGWLNAAGFGLLGLVALQALSAPRAQD
jgi:hypothetical protein